jgi:hypothetical protein
MLGGTAELSKTNAISFTPRFSEVAQTTCLIFLNRFNGFIKPLKRLIEILLLLTAR